MPCVVYCHGSSGSRIDAFEMVDQVLSLQISVFVFDFSGSGLSEGDYVSLGYYESRDIKTVVDYLTASNSVSRIALWGRSMGAVSSVLYASRDPRIAALVLDSAFTSLEALSEDLMTTYKFVPKALASYFLEKVKAKVSKIANFNLSDIDTARYMKRCLMPIAFIHGLGDTLVNISHSRALFEISRGEKLMFEVDGAHNSTRKAEIVGQVGVFLSDALGRTNYYAEEDELDIPLETDRPNMPEMKSAVRAKMVDSKVKRRRRRPLQDN